MYAFLCGCQVAREHEVLVRTEGAGDGELTGQVIYPSQQLEQVASLRRGTGLFALIIQPKVSCTIVTYTMDKLLTRERAKLLSTFCGTTVPSRTLLSNSQPYYHPHTT